jgi:Flp pilus assembly protein TadG
VSERCRPGSILSSDSENSRQNQGQAAVELALVLPIIVLVLMVAVQVVLIGRDQVLVVHAAREAARQAAVDPSPTAARDAAEASSQLDRRRLSVRVSGRGAAGTRVKVEVRYRSTTDVPLAGTLIKDVTLTAQATMRVEH